MSREVIGPDSDEAAPPGDRPGAGPDRPTSGNGPPPAPAPPRKAPGPRPGTPPGPRLVAGDGGGPANATAPAGPAGRLLRWPQGTPGWVRGPAGAAVAAAAGLVLGGLVATSATEQRERTQAFSEVRLLAGLVTSSRGDASPAEDGGVVVPLDLVVINAGRSRVQVTGLDVSAGGDDLTLQEQGGVDPGRTARLPVEGRPDCGGGPAGDLVLSVTAADGTRSRVVPEDLGRGAALRPLQVRDACARATARSPVEVWRVVARPDGRLTVQLRNVVDRPVEVGVRAPTGTRVVAEQGLPVVLNEGRSAFLDLTLEVDRCTSVAQRADAGEQVQLVVDGDPGVAAGLLDPYEVTGWVARQVALTC
jgi:hypothetical protein